MATTDTGFTNEICLNDPPEDGISCMQFSDFNTQMLIASSWDSSIRIYNVSMNKLVLSSYNSVPQLSCCFSDSNHAYAGGLDGLLKVYDMPSMKPRIIGSHEKAIRCTSYSKDLNIVVSGSWDGTTGLWDDRSTQAPTMLNQGDKVYALCLSGTKLICANASRKIYMWDLRFSKLPLSRKETGHKYQTRDIQSFPNGDGYAFSTIEGRVAIDPLEKGSGLDKYSFKCHRSTCKEKNMEIIYPVNSLSFHNLNNTFASGGSDGLVIIWDAYSKKKLFQLRKFPNSIPSICFNSEGNLLAIASSYQYEDQDLKDSAAPDAIYIRKMNDSETKPKNQSN